MTIENIVLALTYPLEPNEIIRFVKLASDEVRGELKAIVSDTIALAFNLSTHDPENKLNMSYQNEIKVFELLTKFGYQLNAQLFHSLVSLETVTFNVNATDEQVKAHVTLPLPNAIGSIIKGWTLIRSDNANIEPISELIDTLAANGIKVRTDDLKRCLRTSCRVNRFALNF